MPAARALDAPPCGSAGRACRTRRRPRRPTDGSGQLDHIGLAVAAPGDVDAWAAHLRAAGVTLKTEPKTHRDGSRSIYVEGPEGLVIQIIHHAPMVS